MKKTILFAAIFSIVSAFAVFAKVNAASAFSTGSATIAASFKIINDTDNDVNIHTGRGFVELNANGGSTSITCEAGTEISLAEKGKKKGVLFVVEDSMCGRVVKLSKYLE